MFANPDGAECSNIAFAHGIPTPELAGIPGQRHHVAPERLGEEELIKIGSVGDPQRVLECLEPRPDVARDRPVLRSLKKSTSRLLCIF
jgi:hypothetical protein